MSIQPSPTLAVDAKAKSLKAAGVDVISFGVGEPDFRTPAHICQAAKEAIDSGFHGYTAADGMPELKKAVAEKFKRDNGLDYGTDQVIINVGGKHAITINALAAKVCSAFGVSSEVIHLPDRPREVKHAYSTWAKSEALLGYEERWTIDDGIRRMAEWAQTIGPQPWSEEKLELPSRKAPAIWAGEDLLGQGRR